MKIHETPFDQPDISELTPEVDISGGRSDDYRVIIVNGYGKYEPVWLYWHDIEKTWKYSSNGETCNHETVRIDGSL